LQRIIAQKSTIKLDAKSKIEQEDVRPSSSYNTISFTPKSITRPFSPSIRFRDYPNLISKYPPFLNKTPKNIIENYPMYYEYRNLRKRNLSSLFHGNIPDNSYLQRDKSEPDFPNFSNSRIIGIKKNSANQFEKRSTPIHFNSPIISNNVNQSKVEE